MNLCSVKLVGQTLSLLSVTVVNFSFFFLIIPNHWSWGLLFTAGLNGFLGGLYILHDLLCVYFTSSSFLQRVTISSRTDLLRGLICWTISSSPGISQMSLALVTVVAGSGCWFTTVWWYLFGLRVLVLRIIIVFFVSTPDRYFCYPYKLSWWGSVIVLKYPGLEGDILKMY